MNKLLDKKLCEKYPLIFRDRHGNMRDTAMCWGFECGDGWYNIIDTLCRYLTSGYTRALENYDWIKDKVNQPRFGGNTPIVTQQEIDEAKDKVEKAKNTVPVAVQVKEKFGSLRFYVSGATDEQYNYIHFAESMSCVTCEECGAPGKSYSGGWIRTLCDIHAEMDGRKEEDEE